MVNIPLFSKGFIHPKGGCLGFLNHQQYVFVLRFFVQRLMNGIAQTRFSRWICWYVSCSKPCIWVAAPCCNESRFGVVGQRLNCEPVNPMSQAAVNCQGPRRSSYSREVQMPHLPSQSQQQRQSQQQKHRKKQQWPQHHHHHHQQQQLLWQQHTHQ